MTINANMKCMVSLVPGCMHNELLVILPYLCAVPYHSVNSHISANIKDNIRNIHVFIGTSRIVVLHCNRYSV